MMILGCWYLIATAFHSSSLTQTSPFTQPVVLLYSETRLRSPIRVLAPSAEQKHGRKARRTAEVSRFAQDILADRSASVSCREGAGGQSLHCRLP